MEIKDLRIVFMGTPDFAAASLEALHEEKFNIAGVITAPDKPSGRGLKLLYSPVKKFCLEQNIRILQPEKLKNKKFISDLKSLNGNLFIVVAFRMLPELVWEMPSLGTINLHASLLPQYRGAAPINHVIINGEKETGLTTFFIDKKIDTGHILYTTKLEIKENETAGELHDRLKTAGSDLLKTTILSVAQGKTKPIRQSELIEKNIELKTAPKISKEDCRINWKHNNIRVHNLIRGLSPYPGAFTELLSPENTQTILKIYKSEINTEKVSDTPGIIKSDGRTSLQISCSSGSINLIELQAAGKKRMRIDEFLRGFKNIQNYTSC